MRVRVCALVCVYARVGGYAHIITFMVAYTVAPYTVASYTMLRYQGGFSAFLSIFFGFFPSKNTEKWSFFSRILRVFFFYRIR